MKTPWPDACTSFRTKISRSAHHSFSKSAFRYSKPRIGGADRTIAAKSPSVGGETGGNSACPAISGVWHSCVRYARPKSRAKEKSAGKLACNSVVDKWRIPRDELSAKAPMMRFAAPSLLSGAVSANNHPRGEMHRFIAILIMQ